MLEFNIAPNTQIGRIEIPDKVYEHENAYKLDKYSRSGEFVENLVSDNIIEYCSRWFHLATFKEFIDDIDEFFYDKGFGNFSNLVNSGFGTAIESPIIPTYSGVECPIEFSGSKVENPIKFIKPMPKINKETV